MKYLPIIGFLAISGCAEKPISVIYFSDPPGAVIYNKGEQIGFAPIKRNYIVADEDKKTGYIKLDDYNLNLKAVWASGAISEFPKNKIIYLKKAKSNNNTIQYVFERPSDVPGKDGDIRSGLMYEEMRKLKEAAERAKQDAESARDEAEKSRIEARYQNIESEKRKRQNQYW